jgi:hypothetical protein
MSGHRRAAVALHGLHGSDREWMLAELPAPDQRILRGYLKELDALGFTSELALADDFQPIGAALITPVMPATAHAAENNGSNVREQLQQASALEMLACLQNEPIRLIACFLNLHAWSWRAAFLSLLPGASQLRIRPLLENPAPPAPSMASFLLDAVAARLGTLSVVPAEPPVMAGTKTKRRGWRSSEFWTLPWKR